jgi:hypothetical protein
MIRQLDDVAYPQSAVMACTVDLFSVTHVPSLAKDRGGSRDALSPPSAHCSTVAGGPTGAMAAASATPAIRGRRFTMLAEGIKADDGTSHNHSSTNGRVLPPSP